MPQTWVSKTTGKVFLVDKNKHQEGINPAVREEFEASRSPQEQEKAKVLLEPRHSQNPNLN